MAIHPIEFRYGTPEMKNIWEEENKLQRMLDVEAALALAEGKLGIPSGNFIILKKCNNLQCIITNCF